MNGSVFMIHRFMDVLLSVLVLTYKYHATITTPRA